MNGLMNLNNSPRKGNTELIRRNIMSDIINDSLENNKEENHG